MKERKTENSLLMRFKENVTTNIIKYCSNAVRQKLRDVLDENSVVWGKPAGNLVPTTLLSKPWYLSDPSQTVVQPIPTVTSFKVSNRNRMTKQDFWRFLECKQTSLWSVKKFITCNSSTKVRLWLRHMMFLENWNSPVCIQCSRMMLIWYFIEYGFTVATSTDNAFNKRKNIFWHPHLMILTLQSELHFCLQKWKRKYPDRTTLQQFVSRFNRA